MEERPESELISIPATPRAASTPEILTPTGQRSPRPHAPAREPKSGTWTPTSFISPRFLSPIGTPMKRVLVNMKGYLEEVGHLTKLNPQDAWLPITESRNGNAHYAAFHNLNAGIGFQALLLPVAFSFLGWGWGMFSLTVAYLWQLYTLWILVQLHEAVPGKRYNRYVELAQAAFGEKMSSNSKKKLKSGPLDKFFIKRKRSENTFEEEGTTDKSSPNQEADLPQENTMRTSGFILQNRNFVDVSNVPVDPGDRKMINEYHPDQRDDIRREYILRGAVQPMKHYFPPRKIGGKTREKLGVWLALFPTVYLSAGTATALILVGGQTMKLFFQIVCGPLCTSNPLTTVEWYLVFTSLCIVLSQLPNLNSIAGLSLVGAVTAITYSTMVWVLSVSQPRPPLITYQPISLPSVGASLFSVLNALGIIAFAFRGHNLAMEIQATMPSTFKNPAHVPMWKGAKVAYVLIAMCLFPMSIGGYWAYGNLMPTGGMLTALYEFHVHGISRGLLAITFLLVVFNCLSSFQIYSMPVFDSFEASYTSRTNRPCSVWVRSGFRVFYGFLNLLIGVAFPFLSSLAGLLGGLTLPVTFAFPCFMWVLLKQPPKYSFNWYFHWILGWLGIGFSLAFTMGGVWSIVNSGLKLKFFKP